MPTVNSRRWDKRGVGPLKLLIADDHTILRKGLKKILSAYPKIDKVDEAANGPQVLKKVAATDYNCVLLDIHLPGRNGIDILKQIKSLKPDLPILILTMYPEDLYGLQAIKAGASGYITKNSQPTELEKAIYCICSGKKYITPRLAEKLAAEVECRFNGTARLPHETLTNRESQILALIASGRTASEIARQLCLSVKTISTHRANILEKMGLRNNAELTHYAIKNSLIF